MGCRFTWMALGCLTLRMRWGWNRPRSSNSVTPCPSACPRALGPLWEHYLGVGRSL
ncbi:hypothetical protein FKM82_028815 [Ascaphus truei]